MVGLELQWRNKGIKGTRPKTLEMGVMGLTYGMGISEGS
jgi:hypothetical protein